MAFISSEQVQHLFELGINTDKPKRTPCISFYGLTVDVQEILDASRLRETVNQWLWYPSLSCTTELGDQVEIMVNLGYPTQTVKSSQIYA